MNLIQSSVVFMVYLNFGYCEYVELKTNYGVINGLRLKSRDGRPYYSYTGIPYAKPPIGELRFKTPVPIEPWNETLDATKEPNICVQEGNTEGHEDCLYLNVYSPKTDKYLLPVMFWIHGGGFTWGHSRSDQYGPEFFMDKDIIIVTIHYRLGILGFLSTEDNVIPGNYGMKDQVVALRWVQENIISFNGDPNRVTIFGGSAGSASVGFHMLSPRSKGLFHKAILQSGSPVCTWAVTPSKIARKRAYAVATIAGCNFVSSEDVLNCLRKLPARYLTKIHTKLYSWNNLPHILFSPVVENCNSEKEAFLCRNPIYDFKQESFVPSIIGLNSAEGGLVVAAFYNESSLVYPDFRIDFNRLVSLLGYYNFYTKPEFIDEIGEKLFKRYYPSGNIDDHSHLNTVKFISDLMFTHCVFDMSYKLSSPVYIYLYNYQNEFSYNKIYGPCKKPLGVTHGDELNSIFKLTSSIPNDLNKKDREISKLVINIWYKFATSDNPTIDGLENSSTWPKFTKSNQYVLYLNSSHPSIIQNPFIEDYEFWKKLPFHNN